MQSNVAEGVQGSSNCEDKEPLQIICDPNSTRVDLAAAGAQVLEVLFALLKNHPAAAAELEIPEHLGLNDFNEVLRLLGVEERFFFSDLTFECSVVV